MCQPPPSKRKRREDPQYSGNVHEIISFAFDLMSVIGCQIRLKVRDPKVKTQCHPSKSRFKEHAVLDYNGKFGELKSMLVLDARLTNPLQTGRKIFRPFDARFRSSSDAPPTIDGF